MESSASVEGKKREESQEAEWSGFLFQVLEVPLSSPFPAPWTHPTPTPAQINLLISSHRLSRVGLPTLAQKLGVIPMPCA